MKEVRKSRILQTIPLVITICFFSLPAYGKYGGGTGEPNDPFLIYTAEQMDTIGAEPNDWDKHFKLMSDIDLGSYTGTSFNIIGYDEDWRYDKPFSGVFNGNGKTISNFSYTSEGRGYIGLFGHVAGVNAEIKDLRLVNPDVTAGTGRYVGSIIGLLSTGAVTACYVEGGSVSGTVRDTGGLVGSCIGIINNCHVENISVSGDSDTGALVGSNGGRITNCYSQANVSGNSYIGGLAGYNAAVIYNSYSAGSVSGGEGVGGLVGYNDGVITSCYAAIRVWGGNSIGGLVGYTSGTIADCYTNGSVSGDNGVGGLVGYNDSFAVILNCYSVGQVAGTFNVGGLVGYNYAGVVLNSLWDIFASGQLSSDGGTGSITIEMRNSATFMNLGWDFVGQSDGPHDIWAKPTSGGYMVLWWQLTPLPALPDFSGGSGKPDDPYLVSDVNELNSIGHNPRLMEAHFKLTNDIDLTGMDFFIIGGLWYPYRGVFDGNGKKILNFTYNSTNENFIGFFGCVHGINTWIRDLGLINPKVDTGTESYVVGSLVGWLENATITDCYAQGANVSGGTSVGGLVGTSFYGLIGDSYTTGNVSGNEDVGGLVGFGESDTEIYNSYSTCTVMGGYNVGGLTGWNNGRIDNCFYIGSVSGDSFVGGLVGYKHQTVMNCYVRADVSGDSYVGGLLGYSCCGTTLNCYSTETVRGNNHFGGLVGYNDESEIWNSFWDIETSGLSSSAGGRGKTKAEMYMQSTFAEAGWDFVDEFKNGTDDIWWILESQDYPRLWWELIPEN